MVTVSARTGEGLDELRRALRKAAAAVKGRSAEGPARLPIDRVFSVRGFGTVVTGTLVSGRIRADDRLAVLPSASSGRPVGVRGVQVHGSRREEAIAGQRAAVNVANLEVGDLDARAGARHARGVREHGAGGREPRAAARRPPAATRRARPLPPGHRGDHRPGGRGRPGQRRSGAGDRSRRTRIRPPAARASGGADEARPVHPARLLAADDDRRRRNSRSGAAARGDSNRRPRWSDRASWPRAATETSRRFRE